MSFRLHPAAEAELRDAASFYVRTANSRVAEAFLSVFERVIALLVENQRRGPPFVGGLRVYRFNRFPYSVVYAEHVSAGPQIFAVAHDRRAPMYWAGRTPDL